MTDPASLNSPFLPSSDLFQDLSQLQETWLTEGEIPASGPLFLLLLLLLLLGASAEDFLILTVMWSVWLKNPPKLLF